MKFTGNFLFACCVAVGVLSSASVANAQSAWLKNGLRLAKTPLLRAPLTDGIDRAVWRGAKAPDIRLSVARLDHAILLNYPMDKRPHSTAFLFHTHYKGIREVWAVTANHVVQPGEKVRLTFYDHKKEIPVDGQVVQLGPALLSDAALIKLPASLPQELRPLALNAQMRPQEKLTTWGYASNKLYQIKDLTFEKNNTRFIRTDFPSTQTKRSGLCGGPLLNAQGQAQGIHCGSTEEDKAYAASVSVIPFLLKAYYEGNADIPLFMKQYQLGTIHIEERIWYMQCLSKEGMLINAEPVYDQLHQSDVLSLLSDPEVRYMRFLLGPRYENKIIRILVYDKQTQKYWFEKPTPGRNFYE